MVGTHIRGLRHLLRNVKADTVTPMIGFDGLRVYLGNIYRTTTMFGLDHILAFLQNGSHRTSIELEDYNSASQEIVQSLMGKHRTILKIDTSAMMQYLGREVILLPTDINENWQKFVESNKKLLSHIWSKYASPEDPICRYIYTFTTTQPNLFAWAITNYRKEGVPLVLIKNILMISGNYGQLAKKLSKGTITAYNGLRSILALFDELVALRREKKAKDILNQFNTAQKRILLDVPMDYKFASTLSRFSRLSDVKQRNFIRKMSTIEDKEELVKQLKYITNGGFDWNKESVLGYVETLNNDQCDVVYNEGDILLIKVYNFDTIKYLGKTTNWCIAKNKAYWNNYISDANHATQYIMFNFSQPEDSELSIVGFTVSQAGVITSAHSFTNQCLLEGTKKPHSLTSYMGLKDNIYQTLIDYKVPFSTFVNISNIKVEYTRRAILSYLHSSQIDYEEWCNNEESLVIVGEVESLEALLPEVLTTILNTEYEHYVSRIALFFDFNEAGWDSIKCAIIHRDNDTLEEKCKGILNAYGYEPMCDFEEMLEMFGLPYNIICRTNDKKDILLNDIANFRMKRIDAALSDNNIVKWLKGKHVSKELAQALNTSLRIYKSWDMFEVLQKHDLKISEILKEEHIHGLITNVVYDMISNERRLDKKTLRMPTEEEMSDLTKINGRQQFVQICACVKTIKYCLEDMTHDSIWESIFYVLDECSNLEVIDFLFRTAIDMVPMNSPTNFWNQAIKIASSRRMNDTLSVIVNENTPQNILDVLQMTLSTKSDLFKKVVELQHHLTPTA